MLKPADITDTRCTRKNSRHISYNINTPYNKNKCVSWVQNTPGSMESMFLVKQNAPDYMANINFLDTRYTTDKIMGTFLMI